MWFARGENPLDKLVVPLTILRSAYVALFTTIVDAAGGSQGLRIFLLIMAVLGTVFDLVQVVALVWASVRQEASPDTTTAPGGEASTPTRQPLVGRSAGRLFPPRRVYFMRIIDTYVSATIGFGSLLATIELVDSSQFFATVPIGKPSGVWLTVLNYTFVTFQIIGGVGYGAYVPQKAGALFAAVATNLVGWVVTFSAGSVILSAALRDYRANGRGAYLA